MTWFIYKLTVKKSSYTSRWKHTVALTALPLATVLSVIVALFTVNIVGEQIPPSELTGCIPVGSGNPQYSKPFLQAYEAAGGQNELGCAITPIVSWADGFQQGLQGPKGVSIITAVTPSQVIILDPDEYKGFQRIAGQAVSFTVAGYPTSGKVRLQHGWMIHLGEGGEHQPSAMIEQNGSSWYWVSADIWPDYSMKFGGPDGKYGYPIAQGQQLADGFFSQNFEYGSLYYRADVGVLTTEQYTQLKEGKLHPAPSPRSPAPSIAPLGLQVKNFYDVNSDGGVSYRLGPNEHADQSFRTVFPFIDQIGVIIGLDPANKHSDQHALELELLTPEGKLLGRGYSPLADNVNTVLRLQNISVETGQTYIIRVYNRSTDVLGVYLNNPRKQGETSTATGPAVVNGVKEPGVLSGFVEGRTLND
jgi:hypothetical protein